MDSGDALQLVALIILLALSAFFSSSETALSSVSKIRIRTLADSGNKRAVTVQKLLDDQTKMLTAILIGNNVVNLSASALSTVLAAKLAVRTGTGIRTGTMIGIATGILTLLILIFGEITPKNAAVARSETIALRTAPVIYVLARLLTPVIVLTNTLSGTLMHLMGIYGEEPTASMTEGDFLTVIDVSHQEGVIETEEKELITNVVDFGDSLAENVMVPRIDVTFLDVDSTYEEAAALFREEKYARIPVYEEDKDHIIGILNLKDLFCYTGSADEFSIRTLLRKPYFTYEFRKVSDLMMEMRKSSIGMAIVLDEYGTVAGIITMEDLLEEIVGEIRDEYDAEETDDIQKLSEGEYLIDGNTRLDDIDELFSLNLESEDYDSIAGHMMQRLGHIPLEGESVTEGKYQFTVLKMDKNRIESILLKTKTDLSSHAEDADTSDPDKVS